MWERFYMNIELLSENARMPSRATSGDAGLDFYSPIDFVIEANSDALVPLDVKVEFPRGFALIFKEKSGIATKKKLDIGACVVDSPYRGNVHAHLINNSNVAVSFNKGDKIIQGIVTPVWYGRPMQVEKITSETERGEGGFGSSGEN